MDAFFLPLPGRRPSCEPRQSRGSLSRWVTRPREHSTRPACRQLGGMGGRKRLGLVFAAGAAFVLLAAGAALADNYRYRFASADQSAARSAVLLRSDLPMLKGWKGGSVKPDETPQTAKDACNGYLP